MPVYYNLGLIFVVWVIISNSYDNIYLTKVIAENWEHTNIAKKKCERARDQDQDGL